MRHIKLASAITVLFACLILPGMAKAQLIKQWEVKHDPNSVVRSKVIFDSDCNAIVSVMADTSTSVPNHELHWKHPEFYKYGNDGALEWSCSYDTFYVNCESGPCFDYYVNVWPWGIGVDSGGNLYAACRTGMHPYQSPLLLKISSAGDHLWTSVYDHPGPEPIRVESMSTNSEGYSWVIGSGEYVYSGCHDMPEFHVIRYDPTGDIYCEQTYRGGVYPGTQYGWALTGHDDNDNAYILGQAVYTYCFDTATCEYIDGCTSEMDWQIFKYGADCQTTWEVKIPFDYGDVVPWNYFVGNSGGILNHYFAEYRYPDSTTRIAWYNENGSFVRNLTPGGRVYSAENYPDGRFLLFRKVGLGDDAPRYMTRYDSLGAIEADVPITGSHHDLAIGDDLNMYLLFGDRVVCYDSSLNSLWEEACSGYRLIEVDSENSLYLADSTFYSTDTTRVAKFTRAKQFAILDAADNNPVAEEEFEIYEVDSTIMGLGIRHAGTHSTNTEGIIEFSVNDDYELMASGVGTGLKIGELASIDLQVDWKRAEKHRDILNTMYSVWLDPIKFDEQGQIDMTEINNNSTQEVVLDHPEIRYNLLVSLEWDATLEYHEGLAANFRAMSNYLYDVFDGQVRLDTVVIVDNRQYWNEADIVIHSDNMLRPYCIFHDTLVPGIERPWYYYAQIHMPRIWFGSRAYSRDASFGTYPHDKPKSTMYRTMAHEFGHYAFKFEDEYWFWDDDLEIFVEEERLRCNEIDNYGLMDKQNWLSNPKSSELSVDEDYLIGDCQNNQQWHRRHRSCWSQFDEWTETQFAGASPEPIFLKPDPTDPEERTPPPLLSYIPGPNHNGYEPADQKDYDVGVLAVFPQPLLPQEADTRDISIQTFFNGNPQGEMKTTLIRHIAGTNLVIGRHVQGRSTKNTVISGNREGYLMVLGARPDDEISVCMGTYEERTSLAQGSPAMIKPEKTWLVGSAIVGRSGVSKCRTTFSSSPQGDSMVIDTRAIEGNYPVICGAGLSGDTLSMNLYIAQLFNENPVLDLLNEYGEEYNYELNPGTGAYSTEVSDSLGSAGSFTVWAVDAGDAPFFFDIDYTITELEIDALRAIGPGGDCRLLIDSLESEVTMAILSSDYPIIRSNLTSDALQAGQAYSLAVDGALTDCGFTIYYTDDDLIFDDNVMGDETTLQMYQWDNQGREWQPLNSTVDTASNAVTASIDGAGTYAAFTTNIITGVDEDEHGEILPYKFELSQNYPNPFNPVTTIEYSLLRRSHVTVEVYNVLGQKVRSLIDREESAGSYTVTWNGNDNSGIPVASGVYLYRFQAGDHIETKKMLLLK